MGLFSNLFKGSEAKPVNAFESKQATVVLDAVNLDKCSENLDKVLVNLSKEGRVNLSKHVARVAVVIDYSGSMSSSYDNGSIQRILTRLLPIAMRFDDNAELEVWLFSNGYKRLVSMTIQNYKDYVNKIIKRSGMSMGGTEYAPALEDVDHYYTVENPSSVPAFVMYITDGSNSDRDRTDRIVRTISEHNEFIQFVGIGEWDDFDYLRSLDDLSGRVHDNTGFLRAADMNKMSDEELYTELLRQYIQWLNGEQ